MKNHGFTDTKDRYDIDNIKYEDVWHDLPELPNSKIRHYAGSEVYVGDAVNAGGSDDTTYGQSGTD